MFSLQSQSLSGKKRKFFGGVIIPYCFGCLYGLHNSGLLKEDKERGHSRVPQCLSVLSVASQLHCLPAKSNQTKRSKESRVGINMHAPKKMPLNCTFEIRNEPKIEPKYI